MQRWSGRFHVFFAAALLWLPALATDEPPSLQAHLPFGTRHKSNDTIAVVVTLATRENFTGRLELRVGDSPSRVLIPVDVGQGTFRYEALCCTSRKNRIGFLEVRLFNQRGKLVAEADQEIEGVGIHDDGARLIAWVHSTTKPNDARCTIDDNGNASFVPGMAIPAPKSGAGPMFRAYRAPENVTSFVSSRAYPQLLPTDWRLYTSLDVLIITDQVRARLTQEQVDAIAQWCQMGGRMVIDRDVLSPAAFNTSLLAQRIDIPIDRNAKGLEQHGFALGQVTISHSALETQMTEENAPKFMEQLCDHGILQLKSSDTKNYGHRSGDFDPRWTGGICAWTSLEHIPGPLIIVYFLIFVLVVTVGERILLRRLGRPPLTWVITPVLVILFCVGAGVVSRLVRGTTSRYTCLTIDDYAADGTGRTQSLLCIVPAGSSEYKVELPCSGVISANHSAGGGMRAAIPITGNTVSMSAPVWSHNLFRTCHIAQTPPPFKAKIHTAEDADTLRGSIVNDRGQVPPRCLLILYDGKLYEQTMDNCWTSISTSKNNISHRLLDSPRQVWLNRKDVEFGPPVSGFPQEITTMAKLLTPILDSNESSPTIFHDSMSSCVDSRNGLIIAIMPDGVYPDLQAAKISKKLRIVRQAITIERREP